MIKGTTPTHIFTLPIETKFIKTIKIIYAQNDEEILSKYNSDCVMEGNTVNVTLTQKDTFKFDSRFYAQIQIRVVTDRGDVFASEEISVPVCKLLDDEVLV